MQDGPRYLTEVDLNTVDTVKTVQYGALGMTEDGRFFRYVKFGGTSTINPGLLLVAPAAPANSTNLAISTTNTTAQLAPGTRSLIITNGATAVTQDQFQAVELIVSAGGSYRLRLEGNTAAAASGAITLQLADPLPASATALIAGTDTANLRLSEFNGVTPSLTQALPVGVSYCAVANTASVTYYGWVQTLGPAYVAATSGTKGFPVTQDLAGTAGFVANTGAGASETVPAVGVFQESAANSRASVYLDMP